MVGKRGAASISKGNIKKLDHRRLLRPKPVASEQKLRSNSSMVDVINQFAANNYNPYVQFCNGPEVDATTQHAAVTVQARFGVMQSILDQAANSLRQHMVSLEHEMNDFVHVCHSRDMWWMSGNILELPEGEIEDALARHPPRDVASLDEYFQSLLHLDIGPIRSELQQKMMFKAIRLITAYFPLPNGQRRAVQSYADFIDAVLVLGRVACTTFDIMLAAMCRAMIGQTRTDSTTMNAHSLSTFVDFSRVSQPRFKERSLPPFLDLPAVARKLLHAYKSVDTHTCGQARWSEEWQCAHLTIAEGLEYVMKEAYTEVRGKLALTVGTMLPTELLEEVIHFALVAEELPTEIPVYSRKPELQFDDENFCPILDEWRIIMDGSTGVHRRQERH